MKISLSELNKNLDKIENYFIEKTLKNSKNMVKYIKELIYTSCVFGVYTAKQEIKGLERKRKRLFSEEYAVWVDLSIGDITKTAETSKDILDRANEFWDIYALKIGNDFEKDKKEKLKSIFKKKMEEGYTGRTLENEIKKEFSEWSNKRIKDIARTETTKAYNYGRLETGRENYKNGGIVRALKFVAVMDNRVTDTCQRRHGLVLAIDDPLVDRNTPPLHVRCRSIWEFVDKYDWEELYEGKNSIKWDSKEVQETQPDITWGNPFAYGGREDALPNYQNAYGIEKKLTEYSLNKEHRIGKHKAIKLENSLGYNLENKNILEKEIRRALAITPFDSEIYTENEYGRKYSVLLKIKGVNNKFKNIKTGWIYEIGEDNPRLVTAYIDKKKGE